MIRINGKTSLLNCFISNRVNAPSQNNSLRKMFLNLIIKIENAKNNVRKITSKEGQSGNKKSIFTHLLNADGFKSKGSNTTWFSPIPKPPRTFTYVPSDKRSNIMSSTAPKTIGMIVPAPVISTQNDSILYGSKSHTLATPERDCIKHLESNHVKKLIEKYESLNTLSSR